MEAEAVLKSKSVEEKQGSTAELSRRRTVSGKSVPDDQNELVGAKPLSVERSALGEGIPSEENSVKIHALPGASTVGITSSTAKKAQTGKKAVKKTASSNTLKKSPGPKSRITSQILHFKGKLVILGDISVGKTAIVTRCQINRFTGEQKTTIGVAFSQKTIRTDDCVCRFDIWDSAGEERFRSINSLYYHGAGAGIVVFDVTKRSSFQSAIEYWIPHVREHGVQGMIIALVANKCDLEASREVFQEEAAKVASLANVAYFESSAKSGRGVTEVFNYIAKQVPMVVAEANEEAAFRITQVSNARLDSLIGGSSFRLGRNMDDSERSCC
mmetsp:Transcript_8579/g.10300  ORF Transcript_8579/g.10300 Transcript_8579/m.10300 type:complete len:328 (-) Transcript_8579:196-1179(-)